MIAQFIDNDGVYDVTKNEDIGVSNGELVTNKSKITISQVDGYFQEEDTLFMIGKIIQTQAGINN